MKFSIILLSSLLCLIFTGCSKADKYPLGFDSYIYGKLYWKNDFLTADNETRVVKNRNIYLSASPGDSINYLYHTQTDSTGNFLFNGLKDKTEYLVFFKDTIAGNQYVTYNTIMPSGSPQHLNAKIQEKDIDGVLLNIMDSNGEAINAANIYFFRSRLLAESKNTSESIYHIKSNAFGEALKTRLAIGTWYVYANFKSETLDLNAVESFVISKNNLNNLEIVLLP